MRQFNGWEFNALICKYKAQQDLRECFWNSDCGSHYILRQNSENFLNKGEKGNIGDCHRDEKGKGDENCESGVDLGDPVAVEFIRSVSAEFHVVAVVDGRVASLAVLRQHLQERVKMIDQLKPCTSS